MSDRFTARRINVVGTSTAGKTTMAAALARLLDVPHVELDALHWEPNWTEAPDDVLRDRVRAAIAGEAWIVDGNYAMVRDLLWERVEAVVWLDLPLRTVLWRYLTRTIRRVGRREELWNGNRESLRNALVGFDSLFRYALANERPRRHRYPRELARYRVARLRSPAEVEAFLRSARRRERSSATQAAPRSPSQMGVRTT